MKIFLLIIAVLFIFFVFIRFLEQRSLYYPYRAIEITPKDIGIDYEDVMITTSDGVDIHGWFIPANGSDKILLFSHGNGGNISHRLEKIMMLHELNLNILIFDYRGYGKSSGKPTEPGLYLDAEALYMYLLREKAYDPEQIVAYGESLGGAVAIELAKRHTLQRLIIEGSFSSIKDIARTYFPFIPTFLYKTEYDSIQKIQDITVPKLIMHSIDDEIIPFKYGVALFDAAAGPKKFIVLKGGHNDSFLVSKEEYLSEIKAFLSGV
ncbi:MAG: alpha/beta hydrolase [Nitrospiraceae bacterium]|nr:MAG: alpha/beta hydrolase [Nitrospiraceae bacterium]